MGWHMMGMNGFGFGFSGFGVIFGLVFLVFIGVFVFILVKSIGQWNKNNNSPVLTVEATVVTKRTSYHHSAGEHSMGHTTYYTTFQVESGDRMEFAIPHNEFGYLVEGDKGRLTFQGTRFKGFQRQ